MRTTDKIRKIRVAFESVDDGVLELTVLDLEALLRDPVKRYSYIWAEYVELDSPYVSWEDVRKHGYSCRAFK